MILTFRPGRMFRNKRIYGSVGILRSGDRPSAGQERPGARNAHSRETGVVGGQLAGAGLYDRGADSVAADISR